MGSPLPDYSFAGSPKANSPLSGIVESITSPGQSNSIAAQRLKNAQIHATLKTQLDSDLVAETDVCIVGERLEAEGVCKGSPPEELPKIFDAGNEGSDSPRNLTDVDLLPRSPSCRPSIARAFSFEAKTKTTFESGNNQSSSSKREKMRSYEQLLNYNRKQRQRRCAMAQTKLNNSNMVLRSVSADFYDADDTLEDCEATLPSRRVTISESLRLKGSQDEEDKAKRGIIIRRATYNGSSENADRDAHGDCIDFTDL